MVPFACSAADYLRLELGSTLLGATDNTATDRVVGGEAIEKAFRVLEGKPADGRDGGASLDTPESVESLAQSFNGDAGFFCWVVPLCRGSSSWRALT